MSTYTEWEGSGIIVNKDRALQEYSLLRDTVTGLWPYGSYQYCNVTRKCDGTGLPFCLAGA